MRSSAPRPSRRWRRTSSASSTSSSRRRGCGPGRAQRSRSRARPLRSSIGRRRGRTPVRASARCSTAWSRPTVRDFIEAQPPTRGATPNHRDGRTGRVPGDHERFRTRRDRLARRPDGSVIGVGLPGAADRTRVFERRPATLPPGIAIIPDADRRDHRGRHRGPARAALRAGRGRRSPGRRPGAAPVPGSTGFVPGPRHARPLPGQHVRQRRPRLPRRLRGSDGRAGSSPPASASMAAWPGSRRPKGQRPLDA